MADLDELAESVERLIAADHRTRLEEHAENARELVRRMREGIAECERVIAATDGHLDDYGAFCANVEAKRIRAALTGATEESKSDG
jgi:putative N-acetylmannosamine-6-phosphate epimerase